MTRRLPLVLGLLAALQATGVHATEPSPARAQEPAAIDRLQLETTAVTGNRELPKVMSIVPWKPPEPPAGPERPMGSLIEEILEPLDRDEFRREITYFRDLSPQSNATGVTAATSATATVPDSSRTESSATPGASMP
jgi:hypothetical protein